jgi:hypothetical protein
MSLFDYKTPNMMQVLIWSIDEHGFVDVDQVDLEL